MIEGLYDIAVDTPKRHRRGTLTLVSSGDAIEARMSVGDLEDARFAGTCADKEFTFTGSGDFPGLGQIDYEVTGSAWGNSLTATCASSAGKIEIFGTRLSASAGDARSSHEYMMKASTGEFVRDDGTMYSGLYADGG